MTSRRLSLSAALLVAAAAVGSFALPVSARAPSVSFSAPANGSVTADSTPLLSGSASMTDGVVVEISVVLTSREGNPVPAPNRTSTNDASVPFSFSPLISYNGHYTATATATGEDRPADANGRESASATRDFAVAAPPAKPRNVTGSVDQETRVVNLKWSGNTEPDLLGYQVQRAVGESPDWAVAGEAAKTATTFSDESVSQRGGDYRYRLVAVRKGAEANSGVSSDPSTAVSVSVPTPAATTTTTYAQGPSGDGDGGGGSTSGGGGASSGGGGSTSGGSSGSGGGGSASGGSSSGTGRPAPAPVITRSGTIDMSGFGSILGQTRAPIAVDTPEPDPGFDESLPFSPRSDDEMEVGEEEAIGNDIHATDGSDLHRSMSFLAAGFLATALFMHVLWLKGEVDRVPLEALPVTAEPEGPAPSS